MRIATASWLCFFMLALPWGAQPLQAAPTGSRDFDFALGGWKTRVLHRQQAPGTGHDWTVWTGRGPFEGLTPCGSTTRRRSSGASS